MVIEGQVVSAVSEPAALPVRTPQHVIDAYLPPGASELIIRGIPPKTLEAYARRWFYFRRWCETQRPARTHAPVSENTLIAYLNFQRNQPMHKPGCTCSGHRYAPSTIWQWFSAVRFYHRMGDPPLPWDMGNRIRLAMSGYAGEMVELGWEPVKAPRAYPEDLRAWLDVLDLAVEKHLQIRAMLLTGWYTAARASDLATYRIADVKWVRMQLGDGVTVPGVDMQLRASKANKQPGRLVEHRAFAANPANPRYCGYAALQDWIGHLDRVHDFRAGALFHPLARGRRSDAPVLVQRDVTFKLSGDPFTRAIRNAAKLAGYANAGEYSEHSLRRGRAQFLYEMGLTELDIGRHHGWSDRGHSLRAYLSESDRLSGTAPGAVGLL